ncbi:MAG: hypothetical protein QM786_14530 [Breznakibacter sp.]
MKVFTVACCLVWGASQSAEAAAFLETPVQDTAVIELFAVPSPDEVLHYVSKDELKYHPRLLNKTVNKTLYGTSKEQYLALGCYLADLAYCVSFRQSSTALEYFQVIDEMGKNLNIFPSQIEKIKNRFSDNIGNVDTLKQLYYDVYEIVMDNLFETSRFNHYTLVSAGAFVESVYLAVNSTQMDMQSNDFKRRLGDQKLILDQLQSMIGKYLDKTTKEMMLSEIKSIVAAFDAYSTKTSPPTAQKRYDGAVVISSNRSAESTKKSLMELNAELTKLRMLWSKN